MKIDVNQTLCTEGPDAVRERHDHAHKANGQSGSSRFRLIAFADIKLSTTPNYVVKGIIPRGGLVIIWGPPKCGKSFLAFDIAMHVVLGREYRGRRVQQGTVVYLALEGGSGFAARVEAWRRWYLDGHDGPVPFYLLDVPVDIVADHAALIEAIRAQVTEAPIAVFIDTLNRGLVGDENRSEDMAKFIRAADAIRGAFGCAVPVVHHCGIAGSRPRGHTSLSGADDAQIAVERGDNGNITITVEHLKDGEAGPPMGARLERVELGTDDDDDPITSCVIVPAEIAAKEPKLPAAAKLALEQLQELIADSGEVPEASTHIPSRTLTVSVVLWREHYYRTSAEDKQDTKKKAFARAVTKLQERGIIGIWSDKAWLAGQTGHTGTNAGLSRAT